MKVELIVSALAAMALVAPASAADAGITAKSFDDQVQSVTDTLQMQEESGVYGAPGIPGLAGQTPRSIRDRDFDRYVEGVDNEIRMRNERADADPSGFR